MAAPTMLVAVHHSIAAVQRDVQQKCLRVAALRA
jgi:hypothetical protein